jgi:hypothetical protein
MLCDGGVMPPDGSEAWLVAGEEWAENPRHTMPPDWHEFVLLWDACRGGMGGVQTWPDAGGVNDQAAWVVDAFRRLGAISADLDKQARPAGD